MTVSQSIACKRLAASGLKKQYIHPILNTVQKWIRNEGTEHTVKRLKAIKTAFITHIAGKPLVLPWLSHTKDHVKGPFKCLFEAKTPRMIQRSLSCLMVYSAEISPKLTETQSRKFWSSVMKTRTEAETKSIEVLCRFIPNLCEFAIKPRKGLRLDEHYARKGPYLNGRGTKSWNPGDMKFITCPKLQEAVKIQYKDYVQFFASSPASQDITSGKISYKQEPGYKLRAYANPVPIYNWLLEPLKKSLLSLIREFKADCTFNQMEGVLWAQGQLQKGNEVASVDLSDATNLFPWELQITILRHIAFNDETLILVDSLERLVKGKWYDPASGDFRKWSVGQPLGLGPSFPLFALAHHYVMTLVINTVEQTSSKVGDIDDCYRILGDDIVMNSKYEMKYKEVMKRIGCSISQDKSITSDRIAEFASRIITPSKIYIQNKWRQTSDNNFLDLMKNLGPQAVGLLQGRQRDVIRLIAAVPDFEGGLGWNPRGESLEKRLADADALIGALQSEKCDSYRKVVPNRYETTMSLGRNIIYDIDGNVFVNRRELSDQDNFSSNTTKMLCSPAEIAVGIEMGEQSFSKDEPKPENMLPSIAETGDPRGQSTLCVYERKLENFLPRPKKL